MVRISPWGLHKLNVSHLYLPRQLPLRRLHRLIFFLMFLFCCILDLLILWVLRSWPLYTQCILRCTCMFSVVARDCDSCYWISAKQTIVVMSYLWYWLEIRISGHSHTNTAMFCRACIISVSTTVFFNTIVWPYFFSVSDVILKQLLIRVTYMYGTGRIENCKPTFICVWEIFARFPEPRLRKYFSPWNSHCRMIVITIRVWIRLFHKH